MAFRSCEISSACFASSAICSWSTATSSVLSSRHHLAAGGGVGGSEPRHPCFSLLWFIAMEEEGGREVLFNRVRLPFRCQGWP